MPTFGPRSPLELSWVPGPLPDPAHMEIGTWALAWDAWDDGTLVDIVRVRVWESDFKGRGWYAGLRRVDMGRNVTWYALT